MSKKQDDYYFDNFMKCAEYSCKAAYLLKEILTEFQPEEISKKMEEIHEIERQQIHRDTRLQISWQKHLSLQLKERILLLSAIILMM
ncbi:hypothetical protein [Mediterraneibacter gnavus]|uniref:hypothetical protein n=1 Tax=Mediterraneibacter gnavus TaxID=33038 RepID=UPI001FA86855|nr:hypothetical protein [Mediterraneibacter gnavus]